MATEDILRVIEKQIKSFNKRINKENITDYRVLGEFNKMVNSYNRLLETANNLEQVEDHTFDFINAVEEED